MKDLILTKNDTSLVGTLRVDMLSNTSSNFTIMEMRNATGVIVDTLDAIGGYYKRNPVSLAAFLAFCVTNNIKVTARDKGNDTQTILLLNQPPAGTKYNIVDGTASTKTFRIATDLTASFAPGNHIVVYNADNTIFGSFTEASDSYGAPNTSIVVNEVVAGGDIAVASGKYLVNNL